MLKLLRQILQPSRLLYLVWNQIVRPTEHDAVWVGQRLFAAKLSYKLRDGRYWAVPRWKWALLARLNPRFKYLADRWDCDEYAELFRVTASLLFGVNTVGVVHTSRHYWNVIVAEDGLHWFEPQTNTWVTNLTGIYDLAGAEVDI